MMAASSVVAAALAAVALAWPGDARAEVEETFRRVDYPVRPPSDGKLGVALDRASPVRIDGRLFHGHTEWSADWRFRWWRESDGRCRIVSVQTRLALKVTMPMPLETATPAGRALREYAAVLGRHELGHIEIARRIAEAIDRGIAALPEAPDCATLDAQANTLGQRLIERGRTEQNDYDRTTGHGRSQGVIVPRID